MAKVLKEPAPSSTVARLLDAGAAARAVAAMPSVMLNAPAIPAASSSQTLDAMAVPEQAAIKRELTLSPSSNETFEQLIELYRRTTGARVSASQLVRAILRGVAHCMPSLEHDAERIGRLRLPSNARGREQERKRFEDRIAQAFVAGIRNAASFEPQ